MAPRAAAPPSPGPATGFLVALGTAGAISLALALWRWGLPHPLSAFAAMLVLSAMAQAAPATSIRHVSILLHSVAAPRHDWSGVPVQVHRYAEDHWIDEPDVAALREAVEASGASFEDIVVPGRGHLFTDAGTPDGDADATRTSLERIAALLNG